MNASTTSVEEYLQNRRSSLFERQNMHNNSRFNSNNNSNNNNQLGNQEHSNIDNFQQPSLEAFSQIAANQEYTYANQLNSPDSNNSLNIGHGYYNNTNNAQTSFSNVKKNGSAGAGYNTESAHNPLSILNSGTGQAKHSQAISSSSGQNIDGSLQNNMSGLNFYVPNDGGSSGSHVHAHSFQPMAGETSTSLANNDFGFQQQHHQSNVGLERQQKNKNIFSSKNISTSSTSNSIGSANVSKEMNIDIEDNSLALLDTRLHPTAAQSSENQLVANSNSSNRQAADEHDAIGTSYSMLALRSTNGSVENNNQDSNTQIKTEPVSNTDNYYYSLSNNPQLSQEFYSQNAAAYSTPLPQANNYISTNVYPHNYNQYPSNYMQFPSYSTSQTLNQLAPQAMITSSEQLAQHQSQTSSGHWNSQNYFVNDNFIAHPEPSTSSIVPGTAGFDPSRQPMTAQYLQYSNMCPSLNMPNGNNQQGLAGPGFHNSSITQMPSSMHAIDQNSYSSTMKRYPLQMGQWHQEASSHKIPMKTLVYNEDIDLRDYFNEHVEDITEIDELTPFVIGSGPSKKGKRGGDSGDGGRHRALPRASKLRERYISNKLIRTFFMPGFKNMTEECRKAFENNTPMKFSREDLIDELVKIFEQATCTRTEAEQLRSQKTDVKITFAQLESSRGIAKQEELPPGVPIIIDSSKKDEVDQAFVSWKPLRTKPEQFFKMEDRHGTSFCLEELKEALDIITSRPPRRSKFFSIKAFFF